MRSRMRSNAIDANSFEEFVNKSKQIPSFQLGEFTNPYVNDTDDESEDLGRQSYYIAEKPLDIEIEDEEEELTNQINEMNMKYNSKDRKKEPVDAERNYSTNDSLSAIQKENDLFIAQNLEIEARTLKYLVLGDKATGKTTLLNAFTKNKTTKYYSTKSLEIKKSVYSYTQSEKVKLEFWDTNRQVIDSKMIQTYMKIANGFIFVCDISNWTSIQFIKEQIETVLKYSSKHNHLNMHFFVNLSSTPVSNEVFKSNLELFSSIAEHYHVEPKRINSIDLMKYSPNDDSLFKEFIRSTIQSLN